MEEYPWLIIEYLPKVGDLEFKRLKVAALNISHPTASPFFRKAVLSSYGTAS